MRHLLLAATALIVSVPALAQTATPGTPQSPSSLRSVGSSCIQEMRMLETISSGTPQTPFLQFGDVVHIDVLDSAGHYCSERSSSALSSITAHRLQGAGAAMKPWLRPERNVRCNSPHLAMSGFRASQLPHSHALVETGSNGIHHLIV